MAAQSSSADDDFLPNIRRACEECHNRKIRCNIPKDSGSCQYCQNNNRLCFYLPRNRSGRPRISGNEQKGEKSAANAAATAKAVCAALAASQKAGEGASNENDNPQTSMSPTSMTNFYHSDSSGPSYLVPNSNLQLGTSSQMSFDFSIPDMSIGQTCLSRWGGLDTFMRFPFNSFDPATSDVTDPFERSPSIGAQSLESLGTDMTMPLSTGMSFSSTPATMPSSPPTPMQFDKANEHYSNLLSCTNQLRICFATLQSQTRANMRLHGRPEPQLEVALRTIEAGCAASCDVLKSQIGTQNQSTRTPFRSQGVDFHSRSPSNPSTSAPANWSLIAQAVALVLNIIDVCELLVEETVGPQAGSARQTTLDDLYIIKRLDLSIVQARIALNQVQDLNLSFTSLAQGAKSRIVAMQALFANVKCLI